MNTAVSGAFLPIFHYAYTIDSPINVNFSQSFCYLDAYMPAAGQWIGQSASQVLEGLGQGSDRCPN